MHDILVNYLEVNFREIADQLAETRSAETPGARQAAVELVRRVVRELAQLAARVTPAARPVVAEAEHSPGRLRRDLEAVLEGLTPADRAVFERWVELFFASMRRRAAAPGAPAQAVPPEPKPEPALAAPTQPAATPPVQPQTPGGQEFEPIPGAPLTVLLAAAQQALDLLQVDASHVYSAASGKFSFRAAVPTDSVAAPELNGIIDSPLLTKALDQADAVTVEDLSKIRSSSDERLWVDAGYQGFAAISLAPPLERPIGVLALFRRTPWRLDRRDAIRLEDLAQEVVWALRPQSLAVKIEEVAVLRERQKLAREIHDGLASDLAAVVALFKYYEQRRERDPEDAAQLLVQLREMTEEILRGARNILQGLRPKTIRSEGLLASVAQLVDQFGRMHLIEASASIRGEENGLTPEQKEAIFQILRESLSNVRKHAQASNVWVSLDLTISPWVLTVRDDGRGFDPLRGTPDISSSGSYGLMGMRERAGLLEGTLEIASQPGGGTRVTLIGPPEPNG